MRLSSVIAQTVKGTWETLATPEMSIHEQKQLFKGLKASNGDGKYQAALMLVSGPGSHRASFKVAHEAPKKATKKAAK